MSELIILDSHIWVWWLNQDNQRLSASLLNTIAQAERIGISVVSCFEIAQVVKKGRLLLPLPIEQWLQAATVEADIELLPLTLNISCRAVSLTEIHRDPFDRLIIATTLENNAKLISVDGHFKNYPELKQTLISD